MERLPLMLELLGLIGVVNGAPILLRRLFGERYRWPLDGSRLCRDGRYCLGASKTWRGLVGALLAGGLTAGLLGFGWYTGMLMAASSMLGDLFSSFTKRRMGLAPSSQAPGLDQIPESFLPLLVVREPLGLAWSEILLVVCAFVLLDSLLSPLLYRWHIRNRPY